MSAVYDATQFREKYGKIFRNLVWSWISNQEYTIPLSYIKINIDPEDKSIQQLDYLILQTLKQELEPMEYTVRLSIKPVEDKLEPCICVYSNQIEGCIVA